MKCNLIVIKSNRIEELKTQYELLGLQFLYHQHGNGPFHYSTEIEELVFEIYPLPQSITKPDNTTRLGFSIKDLKTKMTEFEKSNWIISSELKNTKWGWRAVIQDLDGRKVELVEEAKDSTK